MSAHRAQERARKRAAEGGGEEGGADGVQRQLDALGASHVGYGTLPLPRHPLTVAGGRPFSKVGAAHACPCCAPGATALQHRLRGSPALPIGAAAGRAPLSAAAPARTTPHHTHTTTPTTPTTHTHTTTSTTSTTTTPPLPPKPAGRRQLQQHQGLHVHPLWRGQL
jgi:hypothetical protein